MLFGRKKPGFIVEEEETTGDLLEYMESLPEVEDCDFEGVVPPEAAAEDEVTEAQLLASYIRQRTQGIQLTSHSQLLEEVAHFEDLKKEWGNDDSCQDIVVIKGNKDSYYYSNLHMSDNYAMIASLVEEKDLPKTIAAMVRFNCKTYPAPTPYAYFERSPYLAARAQIERAAAVLKSKEEYQDIQPFKNNLGEAFFFSTQHMSYQYAKALADVDEYTD